MHLTYHDKDGHKSDVATDSVAAGAPDEEEAIPPASLPPAMIEAGVSAYFTGLFGPELADRMVEEIYLAMYSKRPMEDDHCREIGSCFLDKSKVQDDP
jgi:hypothetical protein